MKYPRVLALLCACLCCVAHSYPQFQCDNEINLLTGFNFGNSQTFYNRFTKDGKSNCDINNCNWLFGWILKDSDSVNDADCDCTTYDVDQNRFNIPTNNPPNVWICPRHCQAMPQINVQVTLETSKVTWTERQAGVGSFRSQYNYLWSSPIWPNTYRVADRSSVSTTPETLSVILPGATCDSGGRNCHRFQKRSDSEDDVADWNVYSLRSPESCLNHRYGSNWNARILSCRHWKPPGDFPTMTHFNDNFWSAEPKNIHTFDAEQSGLKTNQQSISQCTEVNSGNRYYFYKTPCWQEGTINNLLFSIKPFYTAYRNHNPKGDKTSCVMVVHGSVDSNDKKWHQTYFENPTVGPESKAATYWESPPYTPYHEYYRHDYDKYNNLVKAVRPDFYKTNKGEVKKFKYNFQCVNGNAGGPSGDALYYHSGCKSVQCIDFMTKPCYDNVYRYDEMVCNLISYVFKTTITFQKFIEQIVPETKYREPFMSYGRHPSNGPSYFQISFDNTKIDVTKDGITPVYPNQPTAFTHTSTILVSLKPLMSCNGCVNIPLHGRTTEVIPMANEIMQCRPCVLYEKTAIIYTYQDCVSCDAHHVRNPDKATQCRKCGEINRTTPMRRIQPADAYCTTCKLFQYFDGNTPQGCEFLPTVTDNMQVIDGKVELKGMEYYIKNEIRKEIPPQKYREDIAENTSWYAELMLASCTYSSRDASIVKRLDFRSWCGHQEMVRHQQAYVQLVGSTLYMPLNNDGGRTRSNTTVVDFCGSSELKRVQGSSTVDLECGTKKFSIIRDGFNDPCTLCIGAKYTMNCWPTYAPGLEIYDDKYFLPSNKALKPQPGECTWCNKVCEKADHYIAPVEYSCWWNGTGRMPGVLGSIPTNFSWYKPAPCQTCENVQLTPDVANLVLACGNRVSYRRWLPDEVSDSAKTPLRSIPSIQICCVEPLTVRQCTDNELEFQTFAQQSCRQSIDDIPPVALPYCPPGWYVEPTCAAENPLWQPDCCVKCKSCRGGKFKTDAYYDCPGYEFFDSQDRGCTTSCLTNQYLRNERCIKCEACE